MQTGQVVTAAYRGVEVFSATMVRERELLGTRVTDWLKAHPSREIVSTVVTQSSDEKFHCITITVFWK